MPLLLASRFIWGVGAAAARVISQAVVRDNFEGDAMAKALSYIMTVFILVPIIAPLVGAAIVAVAPWQATVWFCIAFVALLALWSRRLPETLAVEDRKPLSFTQIGHSLKEIATTRLTMGTTIGMTALFGSFASYLASSELIVGQIYGRPSVFPFMFGGIAVFMGIAMFANVKLVDRVGAARVMRLAIRSFVAAGAVLLVVTLLSDGLPPFPVTIALLTLTLSVYALIIPNANTLALLPMGHIAGTASAVIGTVTLTGAAVLGTIVDRLYTTTLTLLPVALVGLGLVAMLSFEWAIRDLGSDAKSSEAM